MSRPNPTEQSDLFGAVGGDDEPAKKADRAKSRGKKRAEETVPQDGPCVEVAIARPLPPLTYLLPASLIEGADRVEPGMLVEVPLRGQREIGCVVARHESPPDSLISATTGKKPRLRAIHRRVSPAFALNEEIRELARWIADYYLCSWGEALGCVSFIGLRDLAPRAIKAWRLTPDLPDGKLDAEAPLLTKRQREVMRWFAERAVHSPLAIPETQVREELRVTVAVLNKLAERGLLAQSSEDAFLDAGYWRAVAPEGEAPPPPVLTTDQRAAYEAVEASLDAAVYGAFLLQGVTGSGKTEVYLRALAHTLAAGKQAIVLVPEISLTPQTVERFAERFGARVGLYHSRLTPGEKLHLHAAIARGDIDVVVGARSAVFSPFPNLGLIILDEEHETSYKQDSVPRYHARDLALVRASRLGATVILGSATPSLESRANAERGKITRLELAGRVRDAQLPSVEIIDMAAATREGDVQHHLSRTLRLAINETLASGHQALLLLNRRGYHAFLFCHTCRDALRCDDCDVAMTHHRAPDRLICHMCGRVKRPMPTECPKCNSELSQLGLGTERLEEEIERLFPGKKIVRIDQDTTRGRHDFAHHWEQLVGGGVDIILGTQMIAKGLHLERVTLVGVVLADMALHQPDFRASERAFGLLTQVAGRAGRGDVPGRVLVQTYVPAHFAVRHAQEHAYEAFYAEEIARRRVLGMPPAARMLQITINAEDLVALRNHAEAIENELSLIAGARGPESIRFYGPHTPSVSRVKGEHRLRFALLGPAGEVLREAARRALDAADAVGPPSWRRHRVILDVDPLDTA